MSAAQCGPWPLLSFVVVVKVVAMVVVVLPPHTYRQLHLEQICPRSGSAQICYIYGLTDKPKFYPPGLSAFCLHLRGCVSGVQRRCCRCQCVLLV